MGTPSLSGAHVGAGGTALGWQASPTSASVTLSHSQTRENRDLNYDERAGAESRWHESFKANFYVCCQLLEMRKKRRCSQLKFKLPGEVAKSHSDSVGLGQLEGGPVARLACSHFSQPLARVAQYIRPLQCGSYALLMHLLTTPNNQKSVQMGPRESARSMAGPS